MKVLARETSKTIFSWVRNPLPAPRSVLETVPTAPGGLRHSSSQPALASLSRCHVWATSRPQHWHFSPAAMGLLCFSVVRWQQKHESEACHTSVLVTLRNLKKKKRIGWVCFRCNFFLKIIPSWTRETAYQLNAFVILLHNFSVLALWTFTRGHLLWAGYLLWGLSGALWGAY